MKLASKLFAITSVSFAFVSFAADPPKSSAPAAAKVSNAVKETDLTTVTLTPQAEQRLGIKLVSVVRRAMSHTRLLPGDVVLPLAGDGKSTVAPIVGGTLEEVLKLADAQADADGRVAQAQVQIEAARVAFTRAEKMLAAEAGSARAVDEAKTQMQLAEAALATARERRGLLGAPMTKRPRLWVRVPVFAGQLASLETNAPVRVRLLAGGERGAAVSAKPVNGPPTANALIATVDTFYELEGTLAGLRPGLRVEVVVPTKGMSESLVVPWSAVLHDIHGGQWVYENTAPQTFVRRRVVVDRVVGQDVVLVQGPSPGAKLVTDGAAELFGTEFGAGK